MPHVPSHPLTTASPFSAACVVRAPNMARLACRPDTAGMVTVHAVDADTGAAVEPACDKRITSHGCHSAEADPAQTGHLYVPCVAAWPTNAKTDRMKNGGEPITL